MKDLMEALGLTQEELRKQVINQITDKLMGDQLHVGIEGEDIWRDSPFARALDKRVKEHMDSTIETLFKAHVLFKVEELITGITLQKTNDWGEAKGEPLTFVQYLIQRAEKYMTEQVNHEGVSKGQNHYGSWSAHATRLTHLVEKYLHYHIEQAMKTIVAKGNETLVKGIEETVKIKLGEIAKSMTVELTTKRK